MSLQNHPLSSNSASSIAWLDTAMEVGKLLKTGAVEYWRRIVMASVFPLVGSILYHYSKTVISIKEGEQALWLQMWLAQQEQALKRVRRLQLVPRGKGANQPRSRHFGGGGRRDDDDEKDGDDGGRFAPPKMEYQPASGISVLAWVGWWPVTILYGKERQKSRQEMFYDGFEGSSSTQGGPYTLTVWFTPFAKKLTKTILMQGRQLWFEKRAKKTEIWMYKRHHSPTSFDVATRPSRPLSSVIVEGNTKEMLREDCIRFLNAERWYISKGIPYRRGYLLHGPPGCGKTSLVTALAGDLRLPIVLVPLHSDRMDDGQLAEILGSTPKDCIILIEDIDCALPREAGQTVRNRLGRAPVTLSGLLNAIDGVAAQEGRLLFMTTNHRDRLDEALIRPGRVDFQAYLGKASKEAAGELFDQFFVDEEVPEKAVHGERSTFLNQVEPGAHSFASLQGVFMKTRDDATKVSEEMDKLLASVDSSHPEKEGQWEAIAALERKAKAALEKEKKDEESQKRQGYVVKRLTGGPADVQHDYKAQEITFNQFFTTFGVRDQHRTSGVVYYEITLQKAHHALQFGFSKKNAFDAQKDPEVSVQDVTSDGCGDLVGSWSVDGSRNIKYVSGEEKRWKGKSSLGMTIGLAANVDKGMIAVSMAGIWDSKKKEGAGIVFTDEAIKEGVYPCFSASYSKLKYCFDCDKMIYGPPPESFWTKAKENGKKEATEESI